VAVTGLYDVGRSPNPAAASRAGGPVPPAGCDNDRCHRKPKAAGSRDRVRGNGKSRGKAQNGGLISVERAMRSVGMGAEVDKLALRPSQWRRGGASITGPLVPCAVSRPPLAPAIVMRPYPAASVNIALVRVGITRTRAERTGRGAERAADYRARRVPRPPPAIAPSAAPAPAPTSPLPTSSCA